MVIAANGRASCVPILLAMEFQAEDPSGGLSAFVMRPVIRAVEAAGVDPDEVLHAAGLSKHTLSDPHERISYVEAARLWHSAATMTGDSALGLHAAEHTDPAAFGIIDLMARCSETPLAAIERFCRNQHLVTQNAALRHVPDENRVVLVVNLPGTGTVLGAMLEDFALATAICYARHLANPAPEALAVTFQHPEPDNPCEYARVLAAPLEFGAPASSIAFARAPLLDTQPQSDPVLVEILQRRADELLSALPATDSVAETVRAITMSSPASATATWVAGQLGMGERTLRRRLRSEGTTLSRLRDGCRRELALIMLANIDHSVEQVAFELGFGDGPALRRAFKRWTGESLATLRSDSKETNSSPR